MIIPDKKKAVTAIMTRRQAKDGTLISSPLKPERATEEDGEVDGRHAAAQDAIMAFHEKSPAKLKEALMNFMDIHNSMPLSNESDEESSI